MENTRKDRMFLIVFLILFITYTYWGWNMFEPDFYHMANTGRDILSNPINLYKNNNFILEGFDTWIQQWLYCIVLYLIYDFTGMIGVNIFTLFQMYLLIYLLTVLSINLGVNKKVAVIIALLSLISFRFLCIRPQLLSISLITLELIGLEKFRNTGKIRYLFLLPISTLLHMNFHMTFWSIHFVVLLPYIVPIESIIRIFTNREPYISDKTLSIKKVLPFIILMLLTLLINPYGINGATNIHNSTIALTLGLEELQPMRSYEEAVILVVLGLILLTLCVLKKEITSTTFLMYSGLSLFSILVMRNCIFLCIAFVYLLSAYIKPKKVDNLENFLFQPNNKLCLLVISFFLLYTPVKAYCCKLQATTYKFPEEIISYLEQNEDDLNNISIFSDINISPYLLWNGVGKVYIESKTEPYIEGNNHKADIITEYNTITKWASTEDINTFIRKYKFDYYLLPGGYVNLINYFEQSKDYSCVFTYEDTSSFSSSHIKYKLYKANSGVNS